MAALTQVNPRWVGNTNGKAGMAKLKVVADGSATWKAGQFLRQDGDGLVYLSTSGAANGVGADAIQYIALTDLNSATGDETGATLQEVGVIDIGDLFEMNAYNSATASFANVGQQYGMIVGSGLCLVNLSDTTHEIFDVVAVTNVERPYGPDATADTNARVTVKVMATALNASRS